MELLYKFIREFGRKTGVEINRLLSETNSSLQQKVDVVQKYKEKIIELVKIRIVICTFHKCIF